MSATFCRSISSRSIEGAGNGSDGINAVDREKTESMRLLKLVLKRDIALEAQRPDWPC